MSINRKIASNTLVQVGGKVVSTILGVVALLMLARYLGAEQFGWYGTTLAFLGFAGVLIDFGMVPATAQMLSEPKFDKDKLLNNLIGFRCTTAFLFFIITPLIALFFPYPLEVKQAIALMAIAFFGNSLNQVTVGYHQTVLKMHIQVAGEVIGRALLVVGCYLLIAGDASFLALMGIVTGASLLHSMIPFIHALREKKFRLSFDFAIWKAIAIKMWPIALSIMFNVVYLKGDVLILAHYHSQVDVGLYNAAYRVLDILAQLAMMIMGILLPLMSYAWSRQMHKEFKYRYQQSFDLIMMLALPMMVGLMLTAPHIMAFFGEEFMAAVPILQLLSVAIFGLYLGAIFGHAAVAIDKQKQTLWIYISNAVITLVGYFYFIPRYGIDGAAWMTVFSELYAGILLFGCIWYYSKVRPALGRFMKIVLATVAMGLLVWHFNALSIFLLVPLGAFTYAAVLFATGGVSRQMVQELVAIKRA